jgi:hypothetical protein
LQFLSYPAGGGRGLHSGIVILPVIESHIDFTVF